MDDFERMRRKIVPILHEYNISKAEIFGSASREDNTPKSDIDILVELDPSYSLLKYIEIKNRLEDALGTKVDLVEYETIRQELRSSITKDTRRIFGI
jgi:hypothetical protein